MHLKQDRMSSKERMDAILKYGNIDRVPINMIALGFPSRNVGQSIRSAYDDPQKCFHAMLWTAEQYGWDVIPQTVRHTVLGPLDFGGRVRLPAGEYEGALVVTSFPVETEKDVETLKMPDPKTAGDMDKVMAFAKLQQAEGLPISYVSRSPFSMGSNICGLERFCRWMLKKPELCDRLISMSLDHICSVLEYWVDTFGSDNIFAFMTSPCESNQVISPKQFEKFALPYHVIYHERLKQLNVNRFFFHICGDQNKNVPYFAELAPWPHPSILSFGHEIDLERAASLFPSDIIYGNLEPAVIQTGTPQQVYELSKATILKGMKAPGGFIFSSGCELPPLAPPANVFAMTKALNDFGWYE